MPQFQDHSFAAFLFDMDGTLLDSSAVVERVWRTWAQRHGVDPERLLAASHGVRSEDTIRRFATAATDVALETDWILQAELNDTEGVVALAGVRALIERLHAGEWAIVTSATRDLAMVRLRAAGLPLPHVLITAEDVERGKPDPQGFQKAATLLGVAIEHCLVFEDSPAGVAAAKAAGAQVAIVGDLVPADQGSFAIADYL
ncbi:MAG TPA: HAD-IA family hydrolase [Steroidobacteraceae bacterium]|nr:HAD-IA family hydrolase [Steroidobacteraceae bacterium]